MAKGSGGTRGAGGGGRSSGGGGFKWNEGGTSFFINGINKETEKALNVSTNVSWNAGTPKQKDIWIPKSVVVAKGSMKGSSGKSTQAITVQGWFAQNLSTSNSFKGYNMTLDTGF